MIISVYLIYLIKVHLDAGGMSKYSAQVKDECHSAILSPTPKYLSVQAVLGKARHSIVKSKTETV